MLTGASNGLVVCQPRPPCLHACFRREPHVPDRRYDAEEVYSKCAFVQPSPSALRPACGHARTRSIHPLLDRFVPRCSSRVAAQANDRMGCGASAQKKPPAAEGEEPTRDRASEMMKLTPEKHEMLKQAFRAMDTGKHLRSNASPTNAACAAFRTVH